jgi:hypothetical protein
MPFMKATSIFFSLSLYMSEQSAHESIIWQFLWGPIRRLICLSLAILCTLCLSSLVILSYQVVFSMETSCGKSLNKSKWRRPSSFAVVGTGSTQRDGRRLIRDLTHAFLAHDGVLCTFCTRTSATAAGFARSSQLSSSEVGQTVRSSRKVAWTVHHNTNLTWLGTLLQLARRGSVLGHLSSLRPHWLHSPSSCLLK